MSPVWIPAQKPFPQAFRIAERAALSPEEQWRYEASFQRTMDDAAIFQGGRETGHSEGREEKALEIARAMLARGMPRAEVAQMTGLAEDDLPAH